MFSKFFFHYAPKTVVLPRPSRVDCAKLPAKFEREHAFRTLFRFSFGNLEIDSNGFWRHMSVVFWGFFDMQNSMVMVLSLVDRPLMSTEWSGVVKNFKLVEMRNVTYQSNRNFVLILKMISKINGRGHLRSFEVN